jgi:hypothetical protein
VGVTKEQLIHAANTILQVPLMESGYQFREEGICTYGFMYMKAEKDTQYMIEIQPSGYNENNLTDMFLNIHRRSRKQSGSAPTMDMFSIRVDSTINKKKEQKNRQTWSWQLQSADVAEATFMGILPIILEHVVPFLEDPQSCYMEIDEMFVE